QRRAVGEYRHQEPAPDRVLVDGAEARMNDRFAAGDGEPQAAGIDDLVDDAQPRGRAELVLLARVLLKAMHAVEVAAIGELEGAGRRQVMALGARHELRFVVREPHVACTKQRASSSRTKVMTSSRAMSSLTSKRSTTAAVSSAID